jgi:7-carboxy-7-deazaguanine synthase
MLLGVPSVFVRTSGCNLRCTWCDTPYTSWNPESEDLAIDEIGVRATAYGAAHAVVTGGEPMIADGIVDLTQRLDMHVTIETAGTIYKPVRCDLMSISPKLANSTPLERDGGKWAAQHDRLRYQPEVLKRLMGGFVYQLKFVVTAPADLEEIARIVEVSGADRKRVVLMAEGTDAATLAERGRWIAEISKHEGFRFSPRLHVDLWGNRRGV